MEERRNQPRTRSLKSASITFSNRAAAVDCVVRNASDGGACLQIESPIGIPDQFDLVLSSDGETKPCRVVWRKVQRLGIAFGSAH